MFKILHESFKQWCIDNFGEERGSLISKFYKEIILFKSQVQKDPITNELRKKSYNRDSITNSRIKNIKEILEGATIDQLINAINYTIERHKAGDLPEAYRNAFIFKNFVLSYKQNNNISINKKENIKSSIPITHKQVDRGMADSFLNYDYKCSNCNTIFDPWTIECPKCKVYIDWRQIR